MGYEEKNLKANTLADEAPRRKTWEAPTIEDTSISKSTMKVSTTFETAVIFKNGS